MLAMYQRRLARILETGKKSVLLLGPRQVGKSTLMYALGPDVSINLADEVEFLAHAADPGLLAQRLRAVSPRTVFIDEIQRLPRMLNTIQSVLDGAKPPRFLLTGSSARKLRRGRANLLPGRIHTYQLGPLTVEEAGDEFDERVALTTGMLPGVHAEADARERIKTLRSYASTYVREEIQAEALTRNIEGFVRFLRVAAAGSGQFIDQTRMAKEALVTRATVQRYYEVLEDTLLAIRIDSFAKSERKRLVQHPKYYVFDVGVYNALVGSFDVSDDRVGSLFDHFMVTQIVAMSYAYDTEVRLSTYRTEHRAELDLILEIGREVWAIEFKAGRQVGPSDASSFRSFAELFGKPHRRVIAYRGPHKRTLGDVEVWPYRELLAELAKRMA
jgi:predicted AAA+ superfamily ATPase